MSLTLKLALLGAMLNSLLTFAAVDKFILLPDEDGTTGAIQVTSSKGSKLLKKAYSMVKVDEQGNFIIVKSNVLCVEQEFNDALASIPKPKTYEIAVATGHNQLDAEAQTIVNSILSQALSTPVPFVVLTGSEHLVSLMKEILIKAKIPGLSILLDIVPIADLNAPIDKLQVSVQ